MLGAAGNSPIHHEDLAKAAHHDVLRLQVAVDDAAVVSESYGVPYFHEDPQPFAEPGSCRRNSSSRRPRTSRIA